METFRARIGKVGFNPYVDVPSRVSETFGIRGNVPVRGTLDGVDFHSTLVPTGGMRHRLYVNGEMRASAGVDVGDEVRFALEYDDEPRRVPVPPALAAALDADDRASAAFDGLLPSRRKEILRYLNSLKTPESLERNIAKVIRNLKKRS